MKPTKAKYLITLPTETDLTRDAMSDYQFVAAHERTGDIVVVACDYIRLTQALRKALTYLTHQEVDS